MMGKTHPDIPPLALLSCLLNAISDARNDEKAPRIDDVPVATVKCLSAVLTLLGEALRLAPPKLSVREVLSDAIAALPHYGTDQTQSQIRRRAAYVVRTACESSLDKPCSELSAHLLVLAASVQHSLAWAEKRPARTDGSNPSIKPLASRRAEPMLPVPFRFENRMFDFPRAQSFLLDYLYAALLDAEALQVDASDDEAFDSEAIENQGAVSVGELYDAVGEVVTTANSLRKLQHDTNTNLLKYKIPLKIIRPIPHYLFLKRLAPKGSR